MKNIIITLTTIPSRLTYPSELGIMSCINSLLEQSYSDYEIHFNIPYVLKSNGTEYVIPDVILDIKNDKLKIFRTEDLGCSTKSIPTIERITDPETIIIVVDDDLVYHQDLVKAHIENQDKWKECPVGYDGMRSKDNFFGDVRDYYYTSNYKSSRVDILQHYKSVSYKRRFFENDFFTFVNDNFSWNDDLLFAAYFSYKKRDRIATFHISDPQFKTLDEWSVGGGVTTFPVIRHTNHESIEGCNIFRGNKIDDNGDALFKIIDAGYQK
jgi:hypothetical protein